MLLHRRTGGVLASLLRACRCGYRIRHVIQRQRGVAVTGRGRRIRSCGDGLTRHAAGKSCHAELGRCNILNRKNDVCKTCLKLFHRHSRSGRNLNLKRCVRAVIRFAAVGVHIYRLACIIKAEHLAGLRVVVGRNGHRRRIDHGDGKLAVRLHRVEALSQLDRAAEPRGCLVQIFLVVLELCIDNTHIECAHKVILRLSRVGNDRHRRVGIAVFACDGYLDRRTDREVIVLVRGKDSDACRQHHQNSQKQTYNTLFHLFHSS